MKQTSPIAFVEEGNSFYHVYVSRSLDTLLINCQVKQVIPNDYTGTSLEALFPAAQQCVYESAFSANSYHEIRVVDAVVELCFGQIISSPSCEGTRTGFNGHWVFFSPNHVRIVDHVRPETGRSYTTWETFEQVRRRYPDLQILPDSAAREMILNDTFDFCNALAMA